MLSPCSTQALGPGSIAPLSVGAVLRDGWAVFTRRYVFLLACVAVGAVVVITSALLAALVKVAVFGWDADGRLLTRCLWYILIAWPLWAGAILLGGRLVRGEKVRFIHLFAGFTRLWHIAVINTLVLLLLVAATGIAAIAAVAVWLIGTAATGPAGGVAIGLVALNLAVLALWIISLRIGMAPVLFLDAHAGRPGVAEAIVLSWRMTAQWRWATLLAIGAMLGLPLVLGYVMLVLFVAFASDQALLGLLWFLAPVAVFLAAPLTFCIWGAAYTQTHASYEQHEGREFAALIAAIREAG